MITGEPPFVGENIKKLSEVILFKEPDFNNQHIKFNFDDQRVKFLTVKHHS